MQKQERRAKPAALCVPQLEDLAAPVAPAGLRHDRFSRAGLGRRVGIDGIVLRRKRLANRARERAVDISNSRIANRRGRLVDAVRTIVVAAGKGAACGNEDGGSGKSNLGHFRYSST